MNDEECSACWKPITGPRCTFVSITEYMDGGGSSGSAASYHVECCPETNPEHEHDTISRRVRSAT